MSLTKINIIEMTAAVEKTMHSCHLLSEYIVEDINVQHLTHPTIIKSYNFTYCSEAQKRKIHIRIHDFTKLQNLLLWIRNTEDNQSNPIDLEQYFIHYLKNKTVKQKLIFKVKSITELEKKIVYILHYINQYSDDRLRNIISGKEWVNVEFDWRELV